MCSARSEARYAEMKGWTVILDDEYDLIEEAAWRDDDNWMEDTQEAAMIAAMSERDKLSIDSDTVLMAITAVSQVAHTHAAWVISLDISRA